MYMYVTGESIPFSQYINMYQKAANKIGDRNDPYALDKLIGQSISKI